MRSHRGPADPAAKQPARQQRARAARSPVHDLAPTPLVLDSLPGRLVHQRLVLAVGDHLAVESDPAHVDRVVQHVRDGVPVPGGSRRRHALVSQPGRDDADARSGQVVRDDSANDRSSRLVRHELLPPLAVCVHRPRLPAVPVVRDASVATTTLGHPTQAGACRRALALAVLVVAQSHHEGHETGLLGERHVVLAGAERVAVGLRLPHVLDDLLGLDAIAASDAVGVLHEDRDLCSLGGASRCVLFGRDELRPSAAPVGAATVLAVLGDDRELALGHRASVGDLCGDGSVLVLGGLRCVDDGELACVVARHQQTSTQPRHVSSNVS